MASMLPGDYNCMATYRVEVSGPVRFSMACTVSGPVSLLASSLAVRCQWASESVRLGVARTVSETVSFAGLITDSALHALSRRSKGTY
eukprot:1160442-Pelagomonas_calceolata.AAC.16